VFSEKFESLHTGEEVTRRESVAAIIKSETMALHVKTLEAALDLIDHFTRQYETAEQDALTLQLLGVRVFNTTGSALSALLAGYYQTATMQMRDVLETWFLLDYFGIDAGRIQQWRTLPEKERRKLFGPVDIRKALDARDGFKGMKRAEHYRILSSYGAHPSPESFRLYRRDANGLAIIGPFFEETSLASLLAELAKIVVGAAITFGRMFEIRGRHDQLARLDFLDAQGLWSERFFGAVHDRAEIAEMRGLAMRLPERVPARK
jgi:hypothetical protein